MNNKIYRDWGFTNIQNMDKVRDWNEVEESLNFDKNIYWTDKKVSNLHKMQE